MALASAGLVAFESTKKSVKKATWIYLLACHAGAAALMLSFKIPSEGCAFAVWATAFFLAVAGFGLKIGFPPFHSWLPEAHPAAPAPASAVMSGAMIPLGFYGLAKFFPFSGMDSISLQTAGWTLLVLGATGSVGGILFSMAQSNLKRLLAFSSVENMGIVSMGFGLGALAAPVSRPLSCLCIAGAFVHILNHAFLKGALFLGAGSILRQTGTLNLDKMGGLMRRMPHTGMLFTVNAIALAGLPPFNGFIGELAIYTGAFAMISSGDSALVAAGFIASVALALSGGLAVAAYAKAIGGAFLGEPRTKEAANASETPRRMWIAQASLLFLSLAMVPVSVILIDSHTGGYATETLASAAVAGGVLAALAVALALLRRFACPRGNIQTRTPTWDCGYHEPTGRMAYTPSAITQPLTDFFRRILRTRKHIVPFKGDPQVPSDAAIATETDDIALASFWRPVFTAVARLFQRAHLLQNGSLHLYILIVLLAVLALLAFALVS
jgi:formate hydrogenlyase subunit 3/multisubunit Na+/H+ antiporter MnhD subunit